MELKTFIKLMLEKDPAQRVSLYQLLRHPWFSSKKNMLTMNTTFYQKDTMINFFKESQKDIIEMERKERLSL